MSINKSSEKVGDGIYLSPYFTTSLLDYARPVERNG